MKTHLYTLCWNEADMLEFFFRNYDTWVDRYIIYDDGSTDGTIEVLKSHPRVDLRQWNRKYPDSYLMSQIDWLNEVWKESRGCADWVVMVDMDEFLFTPQSPMQDFLRRYQLKGNTLVPALGYQMLSEEFPIAGENLVQTRTIGTPWQSMCKLSIFNPDKIEETHFSRGRHAANPTGHLKYNRRDELLLFHYKYLNFERTYKKQISQQEKVGAYDIAMELFHLSWTRKERRGHWDNFLKNAVDLSLQENNPRIYPFFYRWWRLMPYYFVSQWVARFKKFMRDPSYMIYRLKSFITNKDHNHYRHQFESSIEKINESPLRKEIYKLTINGTDNGEFNDTVVISNGNDTKGIIIQCQHSQNAENLYGDGPIKKVIAAKKVNEDKFNKQFDAFVITNSIGFEKNVEQFANDHDVKLISRNHLIEFISQVEDSHT